MGACRRASKGLSGLPRKLNGLIVAPLLFPVQGSRVSEKVQKIPCSFAQGIFRQIAAAAGSFPVA